MLSIEEGERTFTMPYNTPCIVLDPRFHGGDKEELRVMSHSVHCEILAYIKQSCRQKYKILYFCAGIKLSYPAKKRGFYRDMNFICLFFFVIASVLFISNPQVFYKKQVFPCGYTWRFI